MSGGTGLSVVVDDIPVTAGQQVTIDKDGLRRSGAADIKFGNAWNFALTYLGGSGGDTINVQGKRGKLSLLTGGGDDHMHIGSAAGKVSSMGNFIIDGQAGYDSVFLHDQGQTTKRTYKFASYQNVPAFETTYTRIDFADASYVPPSPSATESVILYAGQNSDKVDVTWTTPLSKLAILGGPGRDVITGGSGHELLIGGPGADQLIGNGGEDIVIAGSTTLDANAYGLAAILLEWNSNLPYADRVDHLLNGGGLNGAFRLNRAAYIGDGVTNTLTAGGNLDLFFGSKAKDTHDWDKAAGEVFIDPDALETSIRIDAHELSTSSLFLDHVTYTTAPFTVELTVGQHLFYTYGGSTVNFTVTPAGTVSYDASLDGILSGSGSNQLHIHGRTVQIDATALDSNYLFMDYVTYDANTRQSVNLLPGSHFFSTYGGFTVYFTVANDGKVGYDGSLEGMLTGQGTTELDVNGVTVQIDATALNADALFMDYQSYDANTPITARVLPGSHFFSTYGGSTVYFIVANDGKVGYDGSLEGMLTGQGTTELDVNGVTVQIDATALDADDLFLDYQRYYANTPITARVLPGSHFFSTYGGFTVYFTVANDGKVSYDAAQEGQLSGDGTYVLMVDGWSVEIDATALGSSDCALDYKSCDSSQTIPVRVLAGQHFFYNEGTYYYFTVVADGTIDYDASMDGILSGRGTRRLTILA